MATVSMSMAGKLSDLDDQKTGAYIHTKGLTLTPPSDQHGPEEIEVFDSTPSCSPSQSPVRKPNTWLPWDSVLFGNTSDLYWRWGNYTTTPICLVGVSCGRHGLRWQIQPNRSSSDWPRPSCPVLWAAIFRRRIDLGWGVRCCIHAVRRYWLGW